MLFEIPALAGSLAAAHDAALATRDQLRLELDSDSQSLQALRQQTLAESIRASLGVEGVEASTPDCLAAVQGDLAALGHGSPGTVAAFAYQRAMAYVMSTHDDPTLLVDATLLRSLHYIVTEGEVGSSPGRWRALDVIVEDEKTDAVLYEAPGADFVPELMDQLATAVTDSTASAATTAAMAHLWLAKVHPFVDGNGRMTRIIQSLVLARDGNLDPAYSSIEPYIAANTAAYYDALAAVDGAWGTRSDPAPWLEFAFQAYREQATIHLEAVTEATRRRRRRPAPAPRFLQRASHGDAAPTI